MAGAQASMGGGGRHAVVRTQRTRSFAATLISLSYFVFSVVEVVLGFRFVLRLFGANPRAEFVHAIYSWSMPLMAPFDAVFRTQRVERAVFEWDVVLAIIVYAFVAWGVAALVDALSPRATIRVVEEVERVEKTKDDEV